MIAFADISNLFTYYKVFANIFVYVYERHCIVTFPYTICVRFSIKVILTLKLLNKLRNVLSSSIFLTNSYVIDIHFLNI